MNWEYKTLEQTQSEAFQDGVRYALQYLKDEVFGEEITKTSIWEEHFGTEAEDN